MLETDDAKVVERLFDDCPIHMDVFFAPTIAGDIAIGEILELKVEGIVLHPYYNEKLKGHFMRVLVPEKMTILAIPLNNFIMYSSEDGIMPCYFEYMRDIDEYTNPPYIPLDHDDFLFEDLINAHFGKTSDDYREYLTMGTEEDPTPNIQA